MFVWGGGHKIIQKDVTYSSVCAGCGRANELSVVVDYDYSHIYWIYKSVKNVKTYLFCQECDHAQEVNDQTESNLFAKLGGNPIPFMDRFGGVVFLLIIAGGVLIIAGGVVFALLSQASRDSSGAIDRSGRVDTSDIQLGDCFNDEGPASTEGEAEISDFYAVRCAEPHDNEVFALFDLDLERYPEGDTMFDIVSDGCLQRFEPFVGRDFETSSLDLAAIYPTQQSWNRVGDRQVICALFDADSAKIQGSMRESGI